MVRIGRFSLAAVAATALVSFSPLGHAALRRHDDEAARARVSLLQAVESGERAGQGRMTSAEFDVENGRPIWEVQVLSLSGVDEYKVDASTGQVVKVEQEHIRGRITTAVTGLKLDQLEGVKVPLPEALATAERKLGGTAVKVEVEHEHHAIQYDVFVRKPGRTEHMKVAAGAPPSR